MDKLALLPRGREFVFIKETAPLPRGRGGVRGIFVSNLEHRLVSDAFFSASFPDGLAVSGGEASDAAVGWGGARR